MTAAIVKSIDRQLVTTKEAFARAEREIELLREYRIRLVADVVTGKLDVRAVASLLPTDPEQIEVATDEMELGEQADAELTASEELG